MRLLHSLLPIFSLFGLSTPLSKSPSLLSIAELRACIAAHGDPTLPFRKRARFLKPKTFCLVVHGAQAQTPRLRLTKNVGESVEHVLLKALVWQLFSPRYPDLQVEPPPPLAGGFRPDLLSSDAGAVACWAECGKTDLAKILALAEEHPDAVLVVAKFRIDLTGYAASVAAALKRRGRKARTRPVVLLGFPDDSLERFFGPGGEMSLVEGDESVQWSEVEPDA